MKIHRTWWTALLAGLLCLPVQAENWEFRGVRTSLVIDVRSPSEYAAGHVAGAINIPHDQVAARIHAIAGASKDRPILLYCRSGRRSAIAKNELEKQGYRRILDGGGITDLSRALKTCTHQSC